VTGIVKAEEVGAIVFASSGSVLQKYWLEVLLWICLDEGCFILFLMYLQCFL